MLITTEGIIIRIACAYISVLGRITSGVKLINLADGITVASVAKVREKEEKENQELNGQSDIAAETENETETFVEDTETITDAESAQDIQDEDEGEVE